MFSDPMINVYTHDVARLTGFYESIGFRETFRTPTEGTPEHVEVRLDHFTLAISSVQAAVDHHGRDPQLGGRPIEIVLWSDDADADYARLTAGGAPAVIPPHDFLETLRVAWVEDPDGNPVQLVQRVRANR